MVEITPDRRNPNPTEFCLCGCGEKTQLAPQTLRSKGWVRGQPKRYVRGHQRRKSPVQYIVNPETGCWEWQMAHNGKGYGRISVGGGKQDYAHRVFWMHENGVIPSGMEIDHICHNRSCVNPEHLRAISIPLNRFKGPRLSSEEYADAERRIASLPTTDAPGLSRVPDIPQFKIGRHGYTVSEQGCWLWAGKVGARGYAVVHFNGKQRLAHRVYWEFVNGPIPDGLVIDHLCSNRSCVNPAHMELVLRAENNRRSSFAKMTMARAQLARELAPRSNATELSQLFGVTHKTMTNVVKGESWNAA